MTTGNHYFLADVNVLHEAARYYFTHYFHARSRAGKPIPFKDVPLIPTLLASPLPQARYLGEALRDQTLLTAGFIRDSLRGQMDDILAASAPPGHRFHSNPDTHKETVDRIGANFIAALTNTPHTLAHEDFLGQHTQAAARRPPNLAPTTTIPTNLRDLALREVRSRIERVAPENLRSNLLVSRQWWDRGLSTHIPEEVLTMDAATEQAHMAVRDGTPIPGRTHHHGSSKPIVRTMDWEDLVILAIGAQWILQNGGSVTVATGDLAMSQALSALALHTHPDDPAYLASLGVQPFLHKGGSWVASPPISPRAQAPQPPQPPTVNAGFRPGRTIEPNDAIARRNP